jgi:anti-sigma regulatory factor (Ser/Thr protein kinase)/uncharacterized protein YbcI
VSDSPDQHPPSPRDTAATAATISTEMVRIHQESYGSGAKAVKTYVHDDLVLSVLDVELLPAEAVVIASGRKDLVLDMRSSFQLELETSFTAAVERATGRQVIAFLSDTHLDPPFVTELFRLGPPQDVELAEPEVGQTLRRTFPSTPEAPRDARRALDIVRDPLERRELDVLRLVVTELVSNAVRHADTDGDATVELEIAISPATVRVEVTDGGAGFDAPSLNDDMPATGGRGLIIVDQLATRWGITANPTTRVWLEIDRGRA